MKQATLIPYFIQSVAIHCSIQNGNDIKRDETGNTNAIADVMELLLFSIQIRKLSMRSSLGNAVQGAPCGAGRNMKCRSEVQKEMRSAERNAVQGAPTQRGERHTRERRQHRVCTNREARDTHTERRECRVQGAPTQRGVPRGSSSEQDIHDAMSPELVTALALDLFSPSGSPYKT